MPERPGGEVVAVDDVALESGEDDSAMVVCSASCTDGAHGLRVMPSVGAARNSPAVSLRAVIGVKTDPAAQVPPPAAGRDGRQQAASRHSACAGDR